MHTNLGEKNPYVCKFHLENGNLKKQSKKHIEVDKTSSFFLETFEMMGYTSK